MGSSTLPEQPTACFSLPLAFVCEAGYVERNAAACRLDVSVHSLTHSMMYRGPIFLLSNLSR